MSVLDRISNLVRGMLRSAVSPPERESERQVEEELAQAEAEQKAARRAPIALERQEKATADPHAEPRRVEKKM